MCSNIKGRSIGTAFNVLLLQFSYMFFNFLLQFGH